MKILILCICLFTTTASADGYFYAGLGVGKNMALFGESTWDDQGEAGCSFNAGYRHHLSGNFYGDLSISHYSQCLAGPPVDDRGESSSEHAYYHIEYRFGQ